MNAAVLEKNAVVGDNKEIVITKQTEERYTKEELQQMVRQIELQQDRLKQQAAQLRDQHTKLEEQKEELLELINMLPEAEEDFKL